MLNFISNIKLAKELNMTTNSVARRGEELGLEQFYFENNTGTSHPGFWHGEDADKIRNYSPKKYAKRHYTKGGYWNNKRINKEAEKIKETNNAL